MRSAIRRTAIAAVAALHLASIPAVAAERTVTLAVENMSCATCPYIVQQTLAGIPGVTRVDVSFDDKRAVVTFDEAHAELATLTAATTDAGFPSHLLSEPNG